MNSGVPSPSLTTITGTCRLAIADEMNSIRHHPRRRHERKLQTVPRSLCTHDGASTSTIVDSSMYAGIERTANRPASAWQLLRAGGPPCPHVAC